MSQYGISYMGNKSKIAFEKLMEHLKDRRSSGKK